MNVRLILGLPVVLLASLLLATACSDDDDSGDGNTTPSPSVCDQADALEQSVDDLVRLDVVAVGSDGLDAAIDQVKSDVESLAVTASDDVSAETTALTNSIDQADESFSSLDEASLLASVADVTLAVAGVATATDNLVSALSSFDCG